MIAYHHFVNPTPERAGRVYTLWLQQDLFGQWTLLRVRGGRHREPVLHSQVVESQEAGEKLVAQLVRVRLRHGYVEISDTREVNKCSVPVDDQVALDTIVTSQDADTG